MAVVTAAAGSAGEQVLCEISEEAFIMYQHIGKGRSNATRDGWLGVVSGDKGWFASTMAV